jgi:hypothetical protein
MKNVSFKKLALTSETIRTLRGADLDAVAGGFNNTIVVTTTRSKGSACVTDGPTTPADPAQTGRE